MATYAIGDVQGCHAELLALLQRCGFDRSRDRLWFVGDLVNRGPQSLEVLRFVRDLGPSAIVVLGNHDLHLLCLAEGVARAREDDTLAAILVAPDRAPLLDWLRMQPLMHVEGAWAMVHAGLVPQWSIGQARALAAEVERALRAPSYRDFLADLYGSRPERWSDDLAGADRLRVIVNAMTRMRFCSTAGVMEFQTKGEAADTPPGFLPWFDARIARAGEPAIVCGHWSALGVYVGADVVAIDSGCVWGGTLTALRLEDRALVQVPCAQAQAAARRR